ncbi:hypothetical protein C0995_003889 [Termitomyces sp. Mi166|nr:hypothetical protein C0995_003889 [Termitomyces sp. Mi166\
MPSLFSRSRTNSTPKKQHSFPDLDEFGRISSRLSATDRKKSKAPRDYDLPADIPPPIPDGSFLPLSLDPPKSPSSQDRDYGYLSYHRHVVLGLEQVSRLVIVVSDELGTRGGITTPFIFSTTALDVSSSAIKKLIQAFLATCTPQASADAESRWRDEARFAGPHELGMCLRWGLARAIRSVGGQDVRGLLSWDRYVEFRVSEAAQGYPPAHFATLLQDLNPVLQTLLVTLLTLLSRLTANSTSSGHTPPTLSPLFGPLIFGLGPATLAFHHTYTHYLRAVNAMEHLQLVFIRWQDATSAAALGVPVRLKEWIKGYPAMLPASAAAQKPQPRRGVRTVRVMSVRRNVRMYSPDLVRTAAAWAYRPESSASGPSKNGLLVSKEWSRIAPPTLKLPPRYSDAYRKRMDMPSNFHPETGVLSAPGLGAASSSSSYGSSLTSTSTNTSDNNNDYFGLGLNTRTGDDRFRSLTDLKWGEFESMGFSGLEDEKKLQFDLTESARTERSAKRESLTWMDFSSTGFTRTDAPLSATLQFSTPVAKTISAWPAHNAEIAKKLKKTEKALPPFGWDTEPVVVSEEVIEEPFVDVFCDLVYGGGWMDLERSEELDRDCNWALVEFKSLPVNRSTASGGSDPRTSTSLILFEEFVPLEYRQQLAIPPSTRRRLPSIFSSGSSKSKGWKQAPTLNGRPYVVGHVPHSPTYREVEFEEILRGGGGTKVIRLENRASVKVPPPSRVSIPPEVPLLPIPIPQVKAPALALAAPSTPVGKPSISAPLYAPAPEHPHPLPQSNLNPPPQSNLHPHPPAPKSDEMHSDSTKSPSSIASKRSSRFRLPVPSPGGGRSSRAGGIQPAEYSSVEFEVRLARESGSGSEEERGERGKERERGRERDDEGWVDILVGSQRRRMGDQEAEMGLRSRGGPGPDPDVVSLEVAQVLAGVRERTPSPSLEMESVHRGRERERVDRDPEGGLDHLHLHSVGVDPDEVDDAVLRTSEESDYTNTNTNEGPETEPVDDEEMIQSSPITARLLAKNQRRMGYFDLHPDRRPGVKAQHALKEEEGGAGKDVRLAYDADSDEDDKPLSGLTVQPLRRLPVPPVQTAPAPTPAPAPPVIKIEPAKVDAPKTNGNGQPAVSSVPMSKTAALIEMYRERERATSPKPSSSPMPMPAPIPVAPLQPSRLPVRSHSLPKDGAAAPLAMPTPRVAVAHEHEPVLVEPPRIGIEETGRASPGRYVHGAPLHNVMEEEEEE